MALARVKTWIVETLTASDLNAEFNNVLNYLNSGNITIGGTLAVTGATTLTGALTANGGILQANSSAGNITANSGTTSLTTAVTTTLFAIPAGVSAETSNLRGYVTLGGGSNGTFEIAKNGAALALITNNATGSGLTLSISGTNLQAVQTSGGTLTATWRYFLY